MLPKQRKDTHGAILNPMDLDKLAFVGVYFELPLFCCGLLPGRPSRNSFQKPAKRRAKDFLPVLLNDRAVSHDNPIKIPTKYPIQPFSQAPAIGNSRKIKPCESAPWVGANDEIT